ncbi:hypothetical protein N0Q91_20585 (plasmid) [Sinorhizobium sp. K101]|uniref:hypothetical protein n=1 Tax=Sinorhizobium sp. K101 TaxID=2976820 RepID=UPI0023D7FC0F|nr:hypothetical protein [Sinorhizobium sp. K101]WEJ17608.1 hypothetical protein N0Q91_20585 [Sinorhizobium sp. K101]
MQRWAALAGQAERPPIGHASADAGPKDELRRRLLASQPVQEVSIHRIRDKQGRITQAVATGTQIEVEYDRMGRVVHAQFRPTDGRSVHYSVIRNEHDGLARLFGDGETLSTVVYDRERFPSSVASKAGTLTLEVLEDERISRRILVTIGRDKFEFRLSGGPTSVDLNPLNPTEGDGETRRRAAGALRVLRESLEPLASEPLFDGILLQPEATTFVDALLKALAT